jgi:hypothetical protein
MTPQPQRVTNERLEQLIEGFDPSEVKFEGEIEERRRDIYEALVELMEYRRTKDEH